MAYDLTELSSMIELAEKIEKCQDIGLITPEQRNNAIGILDNKITDELKTLLGS